MGIVYLVRRQGQGDLAALKRMIPSDDAGRAARFRREARAASKIVSDHVVQVYDVGEDAGLPYFVMPFVEGGSLQDLLKSGPIDGRRAARLLEPVARALYELHQQGVLHRDLKPSNILYDRARDRALLTDFGLAKLEQVEGSEVAAERTEVVTTSITPGSPLKNVGRTPRPSESRLKRTDESHLRRTDEASILRVVQPTAREATDELTQAGTAFGTLSYMAPEQTLDSGKVTVAADIYGLGATLYHLLAGQPPFRAAEINELIGLIRGGDARPVRSINPAVSPDLEAICRKCLEKNVDGRYHSANELADELRAFLDGRPVQARPVSKPVHVLRWCQRNRLATALMAVMLLAVLTTSGLSWQTWRANWRLTQQAEVIQKTNVLLDQENVKNLRLTNEAEGGQYDLILDRLKQARRDGRHGEVLHHPSMVAPASQVGWEWRRLKYEAALLSPRLVAQFGEHDAPVLDAARSPDGRWLVSCGAEGLVMRWNLQTNRAERVLLNGRWDDAWRGRLHLLTKWGADVARPLEQLCPVDLEWLGETNRVAAASLDGQALLIDVNTGETKPLLRDTDALECVAATADGSRVLFGGRSGRLSLCDLRKETPAPQTKQLASAAVTLRCVEGVGWLVGCEDGRLWLLDTERLDPLAEVTLPGPIWSVDAIAVGGRIEIVVGSQQSQLRVFELFPGEAATLRPVDVFDLPDSEAPVTAVHSVRFDATGREVCGVDHQGRAFVWSREQQRLRWATAPVRPEALRQHADEAALRGWPYPRSFERAGAIAAFRAIAPQNDEPRTDAPLADAPARGWEAFVCTPDAVVRRLEWRLPSDTNDAPGRTTLQLPAEPQIAFDPERPGLLWCLAGDGHLSLVGVADGRVFDEVTAHSQSAHALVSIPRAHKAAALGEFLTVGEDGVLQAWRCDSERRLVRGAFHLAHDRPLLSAAVSPTEPLVACVDDAATLHVWSLISGQRVHRHPLSDAAMRPVTGRVAFDSTGRWLAAFGGGTTLELFQMQPFAPHVMPYIDVHEFGTALLWNPRAPDTLIAADGSRRLMVRNAETQSVVEVSLGGWNQPCVAIRPSSDGRRLFLLMRDGRVEAIDTRRHRPMQSFETGPGEACDLAVDPIEGRVAVAFRDGRVDVWESQRPEFGTGMKVLSATGEWESKELLTDMPPNFETYERATVVDERGTVSLLALCGERPREKLVYLEETDDGVREELVEAGGLEYSNSAVALVRESHGQPVAVFRGGYDPNDKQRGQFEFDLRVVRRIAGSTNGAPGTWQREPTGLTGNVCRFACPVLRDGRLERVLSLREADYCIHQVQRTSQGWGSGETLGRQGDGVGMMMSSGGGEPLFGFSSRPGMLVPSIPYVGWFEPAGWQREVIDPAAVNIGSVARLPDGSPLVLVQCSDGMVLAQRTGPGEWTHEPVPGHEPSSLCCDDRGQIRLLSHDRVQRMLLAYRRGDLNERGRRTWTRTIVARDVETEDGWATMRLDAQQRPVIVSTNPVAGRPGVRVFRPRTPPRG